MMMILSIKKPQFSLSWKGLTGLFLICLLLFTLINLPARLISDNFRNFGVRFDDVTGSIWDARFYGININGEHWSDLKFSVLKMPLLGGALIANFDARDNDESVSGNAEFLNDGVILTSVNGSRVIGFYRDGVSYASLLNLRSDRLVIDKSGTCMEGQFYIGSDFADRLFHGLPAELPLLEGQGECSNGDIHATLNASRNGINMSVKSNFTANSQLVTVDVVFPAHFADNVNLTDELAKRGFERNGRGWHMTMELS